VVADRWYPSHPARRADSFLPRILPSALVDWLIVESLLIWNDLSSMPTSSSILRVIGAMGEQSKRRSEGSIDG
jgi:hypothetical protein